MISVCAETPNNDPNRTPHFLATMKPTATKWLVPLILLSMSVFLASCSALALPVRSFRRHSQLESHRLGAVDSRHVDVESSSPSPCIVDAAAVAETFKLGEFWSFPPAAATSPTTAMSRRSLFAMIGIGIAVAGAPEASLAAAATAVDNGDEASQKAAAAVAKERMAQRIADSKLKYRKPTDLVKDRKDNTDYSCVATTGSPCPEGLIPTSVQRELIGALQMLK
jgi:hypothetical protein